MCRFLLTTDLDGLNDPQVMHLMVVVHFASLVLVGVVAAAVVVEWSL